MNKLKLFLLTLTVIACEPALAQECNETFKMSWTAPVARVDATPLPAAEIQGYALLWRLGDFGDYTEVIIPADATEWLLPNTGACEANDITAAIATFDTSGVLGAFSEPSNGVFAGGTLPAYNFIKVIQVPTNQVITGDPVEGLPLCSVITKTIAEYGNCKSD